MVLANLLVVNKEKCVCFQGTVQEHNSARDPGISKATWAWDWIPEFQPWFYLLEFK